MSKDPWSSYGLSKSAHNRLKQLQFKKPTLTQESCLKSLLMGQSIFVVAPTGSGKTLAYLLPIFESSLQKKSTQLILVPTRELAYQVSKMAQALWGIHEKGNKLDFPQLHLHIGGRKEKESQAASKNTQIHIGTPGRILELCQNNGGVFKNCSKIILDEYDKLLKLGFKEQLLELKKFLPAKLLIQGFSATAPKEINYEYFFHKIPILKPEQGDNINSRSEYFCYLKSPKTKFRLCQKFLEASQNQTIIFVGNVEKANHLQGSLKLNGYKSKVFHRKLSQKDRDKVYQMFMEKKFPILVATDLASRGLDTLSVDTIINYDIPPTAEDYTHRVGRSGRLQTTAQCFTFVGPEDYVAHRNLEKGLDYRMLPHPEYSSRDKWLEGAKRRHQQQLRRNEKTLSIKRAQGLIE